MAKIKRKMAERVLLRIGRPRVPKLKSGDEVIVISGKERNKRGIIERLQCKMSRHGWRWKVFIKGINVVKKAVRPNPNTGERGGIKEVDAPIDISNVMLFNSQKNRGDRTGRRQIKADPGSGLEARSERYFKSTGESVDEV